MPVHAFKKPLPVVALVRTNGHQEWVPSAALALRNTPLRVAEVLVTPEPPAPAERQWVDRNQSTCPHQTTRQ